MRGQRVDLVVPDNGGLYAVFSVSTTQSMSGWSSVAYIYDPDDPNTSLLELTTSISDTNKTITVLGADTDIGALYTAGNTALSYVVLVTPSGASGYRFFYGSLTVEEGGP